MLDSDVLEQKYSHLLETLRSFENVAVAYSGGVDSTFLLAVAHEALGPRAMAITADSALFPRSEIQKARDFTAERGIRHEIIRTRQLYDEVFCENPANRCYLCKTMMLSSLLDNSSELGFSVIVEGSNVDDLQDYRPGKRAVEEQGVLSPLREVGLTKAEIRELSRQKGLPTWDKPPYACLATRIMTGELITEQRLATIEAAEELLFEMGFRQARARFHDDLVRIELEPKDFHKIVEPVMRERVVAELHELGFKRVTLDLAGYKTGSMNARSD